MEYRGINGENEVMEKKEGKSDTNINGRKKDNLNKRSKIDKRSQ